MIEQTKILAAALAVFAIGINGPTAIAQPPSDDRPLTRYTFRNVAKQVAPAVVNIRVKSNIVFGGPGRGSKAQIPPSFGFDAEMREYLEKLFEREMRHMTPNDKDDYKYSRNGSGVIVRPEGYLVTSHHVIQGTEGSDIEISLPDGRTFQKIEIVGTDQLTDLAVLKIADANTSLPSLSWGDSDLLEVGDHVMAVGNPLEFNNSVSEGIVSAKHRTIQKAPIEDLIQTTAMINPGNSGGALVDLDGKLVGINMAIATSTGMWSGLGFAIPSDTARQVTDQLIEKGRVSRGFLGIKMQDLTGGLSEQMGYTQDYGFVVLDVTRGSAAEKAGLQQYDIVAKVDGDEIKDSAEMLRTIGQRNSGETVTLELYRDEGNSQLQQKSLEVTLGERPTQEELQTINHGRINKAPKLPGTEPDKDLLGLQVEPAPDGKGVMVKEVVEKSRASLAGVRKGDLIVEVNRQPVSSVQDIQQALKSSNTGSHLIFIEREGNSILQTVPAD